METGTRASGRGAGPLSRAGEGQGEGSDLSGDGAPLTPTLSRTGEGVRRARARRGVPLGEGRPVTRHYFS
ncbi:MAG: hypothetical protein CL858_28625 [Cupriavidus sp.]|nr:hypothetical protein [Methylobacterium sp.]MBU69349.1 hypothetical protein [Cupriavidus sp.]